jgi:hypothetical protein
MRCYLRADVSEHVRRLPDVELSGLFGIYGRSRTVVDLGVGSSPATVPLRMIKVISRDLRGSP